MGCIQRDTTEEDRRTIAETKKCDGQKMDQVNEGKWSLTEEPLGSAGPVQTKTFDKLNCILQKFHLSIKQGTSNFLTPVGPAEVTKETITRNHHIRIIWLHSSTAV